MARYIRNRTRPGTRPAGQAAPIPTTPAPVALPVAPAPVGTATQTPFGTYQLPPDFGYEAGLAKQKREYGESTATLNRRYGGSQADYADQRARYAQTAADLNPNDPYSRAAALERSYHQNQASTQNSLAARGMVNSGVLGAEQDENTYQYQRGLRGIESQRGEYQRGLASLSRRETEAGKTHEEQLRDLGQGVSDYETFGLANRIQRALNQRPEDPGAPLTPTPPPVVRTPVAENAVGRRRRPRRGRK